jgi:hypothetical protein
VIVFNLRATSRTLQNFFRRHKWRLRPLKRAVLPARTLSRTLLRMIRAQLRIEQSTLSYAANHPEISVREIFPAEPVRMSPRPFQQNATGIEQTSQPARVFEIPNVNFWAYYGGTAVTADNILLADLSPEVWGAEHHPIFSRWHLPEPEFLNGRTGIAVTPEAAGNYYHWLLDALPRLLLLKHATGNFANYDALLLNGVHARYETESLAALRVPVQKTRYVDAQHRFAVASAVIPSMDHNVGIIAPWKIRALRELVPERKPSRRIYISRSRAAVRRVINEIELVSRLQAHEFEILELEDSSWPEQAILFAEAAVVVAPHGAALAISTRLGYREWFWQLAGAAQLQYNCIEAAPAASAHHAHENGDMVVNVERIQTFLTQQ